MRELWAFVVGFRRCSGGSADGLMMILLLLAVVALAASVFSLLVPMLLSHTRCQLHYTLLPGMGAMHGSTLNTVL